MFDRHERAMLLPIPPTASAGAEHAPGDAAQEVNSTVAASNAMSKATSPRGDFRFGVARCRKVKPAGRQTDEAPCADRRRRPANWVRFGENPRRPGSARVVASNRREKRLPPSPPAAWKEHRPDTVGPVERCLGDAEVGVVAKGGERYQTREDHGDEGRAVVGKGRWRESSSIAV